MTPANHLHTYLLRLADDNLVLAQRLGAMVSWMPELEEDIAIANVCLDHIGQARNLYSYAAAVKGDGTTEDDLAMLRDEREFLNAVLVEQPDTDFAQIMARQMFVDAYQVPLYRLLAASSDETLAGIAGKAVKEARYHLAHSSMWVIRLGDGTPESQQRMQAGVDTMWAFTADLFAADDVEDSLVAEGVAVDPALVRIEFDVTVRDILSQATLKLPTDEYQRIGGRTGFHTEHLGHMLPEMQSLYRSDQGAQW